MDYNLDVYGPCRVSKHEECYKTIQVGSSTFTCACECHKSTETE